VSPGGFLVAHRPAASKYKASDWEKSSASADSIFGREAPRKDFSGPVTQQTVGSWCMAMDSCCGIVERR